MNQQEVDRRIEAAQTPRGSVRSIAIPGQRPHSIVVEDGSEAVQRPTSTTTGQVDASVPPMVTNPGENLARVAQRIGDNYNANHVPDPAFEVKLGAVVYRPSTAIGWEKVLSGTRAGDFELVEADGYVERNPHAICKLLYSTLLTLSQAAQGSPRPEHGSAQPRKVK